ncbi:MAG: ABC transporter substrate-binding protein [Spirochaetes bacterium]|nr:ABC transporter substrate-binding protein [Spirochaetota bacterium]
MKKKSILILLSAFIFTVFLMCGESEIEEKAAIEDDAQALNYSAHKLPNGINWITNNNFKTFASPDAKKGGTYNYYINSFPLTFRSVGPDNNQETRDYFLSNQMSLLAIHPNTEEPVPSLATHWAFDKDGRTMYFKLNKNARWSDGKPVTADDYIYTLEFIRSKHINDPFYNDYFTREIEKVIKYDDLTISVSAPKKIPDLWLRIAISPTPKHFYGRLENDFIKKYNWAIEPNTGPYILKEYSKGKFLLFERKKDWWAKDLKFYKNRFNVDRFKLIIIRDDNVAFEYFKKGEIDSFFRPTRYPEYWHDKGKGELFDKGYIHRIWFYTDTIQTSWGFWLNMDKEIFRDKNIRYAFAHAINFKKMNSKVLRGDCERLNNFYSGYGEYTNKKIKAREFDIRNVEIYMKKSGWERGKDGIWEKNGNRYSVTITYGTSLHDSKMVFLKEEAKKAGIEFKLELLDPGTWFKKISSQKHEVVFMGQSGGGLRPSPWQTFHSSNAHKPNTNNATNTDDSVMDKLIDQYDTSLSTKERIILSHKIQERIHDICGWVPLYKIPYIRQFYWRWIKMPLIAGTKNSDSLLENPAGTGLFWIDEDAKKETLQAMKEGKAFKPVTIIDKTYKNR